MIILGSGLMEFLREEVWNRSGREWYLAVIFTYHGLSKNIYLPFLRLHFLMLKIHSDG